MAYMVIHCGVVHDLHASIRTFLLMYSGSGMGLILLNAKSIQDYAVSLTSKFLEVFFDHNIS